MSPHVPVTQSVLPSAAFVGFRYAHRPSIQHVEGCGDRPRRKPSTSAATRSTASRSRSAGTVHARLESTIHPASISHLFCMMYLSMFILPASAAALTGPAGTPCQSASGALFLPGLWRSPQRKYGGSEVKISAQPPERTRGFNGSGVVRLLGCRRVPATAAAGREYSRE